MNKKNKQTIEDVFAERFERYSKYIIQERALPDIRDGLKPVQRRILYAMYKDNNTFDNNFRKSAKTVGNVIGNYHPHGDSSVYEAMVRMSQDWKVNSKLVVMHGNNGSIDGDSPAAMRYTEAKLSKYSNQMLIDIEKKTVPFIPNFDDTELEPNILPTRIPNLLVNGTSGIASGYATEIPPHNLEEVLKAALYLLRNPLAELSELMEYIKGPDFPTGGEIVNKEGIIQAYTTGRGKISIRSKYKIIGQEIFITEIPYDINKSSLLQKIEILKITGKIEGLQEVVDQSDKKGLEIKIVCSKQANVEAIVRFLLKYTDLQKNYNFNMIAINKKAPELLSLKSILNAFLEHRKNIIIKRSEFLLQKNSLRQHIVNGLILAIDDLDNVVAIIRGSKDKKDAKLNLMKNYQLDDDQAESIVVMQLYRLTNTDVSALKKELEELKKLLSSLKDILNNEKTLISVVEEELNKILEKSKIKRKTKILDNNEVLVVNKEDLMKEENNIVMLTKEHYIKRSTLRSYFSAKTSPQVIEDDYMEYILESSNKNKLLVFFEDGTYSMIPAYDIVENKWKELGKPLASIIKNIHNEKIIGISTLDEKNLSKLNVISVTKKGYLVKCDLKEFITKKLNTKIKYQGLKKDDAVIDVCIVSKDQNMIALTDNNMFQIINENVIEGTNIKRVGTKLKSLNKNTVIKSLNIITKNILMFSKGGYYTFIDFKELEDNDFMFRKILENHKKEKNMQYVISDIEKSLIIIDHENTFELESKKLIKNEKGAKIRQLKSVENINALVKKINNKKDQ